MKWPLSFDHVAGAPAAPRAGPQFPLAFASAARAHENQRHGEVGGAVRQHAGSVGDQDTSLASGADIDVVVTHAVVADDPNPNIPAEQARIE